jgi:hypothetical protein
MVTDPDCALIAAVNVSCRLFELVGTIGEQLNKDPALW